MARGRVLRFDQIKGYGFIAPDNGGEDVFLHVNDLVSGEKHQLVPNTIVDFTAEFGDRGAKASNISVVSSHGAGSSTPPVNPSAQPSSSHGAGPAASSPDSAPPAPPATVVRLDGDEEFVDVVPVADLQRDLTERLLTLDPALTGRQILAVRDLMVARARAYGWVTG